jgi:predicted ATPase
VHERAEATITLSREQGFPFYEALGTIQRGWSLVAPGQHAEGIEQTRQGLAAYRATGSAVALPYSLALLAEAYATGGQVAEGLRVLAEAFAVVDAHGERDYQAELYRLQGELLLAQGDPRHQGREAEQCFHQAIEIARRQQAKSLELRAAMSLARLWQQQG